MARSSHLQVYKASYVLCREGFRRVQKLPKDLRYTLGTRFFESTLKVLQAVVLANQKTTKAESLESALLEIELIWTELRLLYDLKGISAGEFQVLSERVSDVGRQLAAWRTWEKKRRTQPRT